VLSRLRTYTLAAAALVALVLGALAFAAPGQAGSERVIDAAAGVRASQCVPCHADLGKTQRPGLIFDHGDHLIVSCDGCHLRQPHRAGGGVEAVPMEVCFACHGVPHGPQGDLATGECASCHTSPDRLRPRSHGATWAAEPHAAASRAQGSVNSCLMCHDAEKDCDECHARTVPDVGPMPTDYHPLVPDRPKDPSVKVYPDRPTSMSQCVHCHPDIDEITPGRLIFAHGAHLMRGYECTACHPTFAHEPDKVAKPDMMSCYRCHGVRHASQGAVAESDCLKCHPANFKLVPNDHTKAFIVRDHKKRADADPAYCSMCHEPAFCVGCHQGKKTSPNAPGRPIIPADHQRPEWRGAHGAPYLEQKGACASCHTGQQCAECHATEMPHPPGWLADHKPAQGIPPEDCQVCHQDQSACQECHHKEVRTVQLVEANCVGCHEEMKLKPATKITNKGLSEHAVHFEVAKKKGAPYTCDECHVGFSRVASERMLEGAGGLGQAAHDLRLCYECHGNSDLQDIEIAPYGGQDLCRRCHTELFL